jgi:hypothetical protein
MGYSQVSLLFRGERGMRETGDAAVEVIRAAMARTLRRMTILLALDESKEY